jgi:DNA-binding response OmpR family regulator
LDSFDSKTCHVVIINLGSEYKKELVLVRSISWLSNVPVIAISSHAECLVEVLDCGAHYVLPNPPEVVELLACAKAALRRSKRENGLCFDVLPSPEKLLLEQEEPDGQISEGDAVTLSPLVRGDITLDPRCRSVRTGAGEILLPDFEYRLLKFLMLNERKRISKDQILELFYGNGASPDPRTAHVYMSRVRLKLRKLCGEDEAIATIKGAGWVFRAPTSSG